MVLFLSYPIQYNWYPRAFPTIIESIEPIVDTNDNYLKYKTRIRI
jgi:hypothetical protein